MWYLRERECVLSDCACTSIFFSMSFLLLRKTESMEDPSIHFPGKTCLKRLLYFTFSSGEL